MAKQKVVIELSMGDSKRRSKALQTAVGLSGVMSAAVDGDKLVVVGDDVDSIKITLLLRKSLGSAKIVSVGPAEEKKEEKEEKKEEKPAAPCAVYPPCWTPFYSQPAYYISDSWW